MSVSARYSAPWSRVQVWITALVVALLVAGAVVSQSALHRARLGWLSNAILLAVLLIGLVSMVRGYVVDPNAVVIERLFWRTTIPLRGLVEATPAAEVTRGSIRLLGNGGFFSTTGIFWNSRLGRYRLYANDVSKAVLLRFPDRCVVLAPGDPVGFVRDVRACAGLTSGTGIGTT